MPPSAGDLTPELNAREFFELPSAIEPITTSMKMAISDATREVTEWANVNTIELLEIRQRKMRDIQRLRQLTRGRDEELKQQIRKDSASRKLNIGLLEALRDKTSYPGDSLSLISPDAWIS